VAGDSVRLVMSSIELILKSEFQCFRMHDIGNKTHKKSLATGAPPLPDPAGRAYDGLPVPLLGLGEDRRLRRLHSRACSASIRGVGFQICGILYRPLAGDVALRMHLEKFTINMPNIHYFT